MKNKKLTLSLDKLSLNKEMMFDLSKNDMMGVKGGVTNPTDLTCHSFQMPGSPTCMSLNTNCFSECQTGCDPDFPGTTASGQCSDMCTAYDCQPTLGCTTYFPCDDSMMC